MTLCVDSAFDEHEPTTHALLHVVPQLAFNTRIEIGRQRATLQSAPLGVASGGFFCTP